MVFVVCVFIFLFSSICINIKPIYPVGIQFLRPGIRIISLCRWYVIWLENHTLLFTEKNVDFTSFKFMTGLFSKWFIIERQLFFFKFPKYKGESELWSTYLTEKCWKEKNVKCLPKYIFWGEGCYKKLHMLHAANADNSSRIEDIFVKKSRTYVAIFDLCWDFD